MSIHNSGLKQYAGDCKGSLGQPLIIGSISTFLYASNFEHWTFLMAMTSEKAVERQTRPPNYSVGQSERTHEYSVVIIIKRHVVETNSGFEWSNLSITHNHWCTHFILHVFMCKRNKKNRLHSCKKRENSNKASRSRKAHQQAALFRHVYATPCCILTLFKKSSCLLQTPPFTERL